MFVTSEDRMGDTPKLGKRIRAVRLKQGMTQSVFAAQLAISASYLNLIEHDRRPLTTALLLRLAQQFDVDLRTFATGDKGRLTADLVELFGDAIFEDHPLTAREVQEFGEAHPDVARAALRLHQAYAHARESLESLAARMHDSQDASQDSVWPTRVRLSSEQVSDYLEEKQNHFPVLEIAAERLWHDGRLVRDGLFATLATYLAERHGVTVRMATVQEMQGTVRRFDPATRELVLSEILRRGSRHFQLAHQIGLLECSALLDQMVDDPCFTTAESRALGRVALANYFASAVLMPYDEFFAAAEQERYDLELLGHRFRVNFEQVTHRVTTLRRPGALGVPFLMVRVDIAGNISKKFAPAGSLRLPRFSGICPLWSVHAAFLPPGSLRTQLSRFPNGVTHFSVARTVLRHSGDFRRPPAMYAVALSCDVEHAHRLIYADGLDLSKIASAVPVGVTCRTCDRMDCQARAFPALHRPLTVDENVRGVSFFAPVQDSLER
jgi:hypothetical protein